MVAVTTRMTMRTRVVGGWRERAPWGRERVVAAAAARGDAGDAGDDDA